MWRTIRQAIEGAKGEAIFFDCKSQRNAMRHACIRHALVRLEGQNEVLKDLLMEETQHFLLHYGESFICLQ